MLKAIKVRFILNEGKRILNIGLSSPELTLGEISSLERSLNQEKNVISWFFMVLRNYKLYCAEWQITFEMQQRTSHHPADPRGQILIL